MKITVKPTGQMRMDIEVGGFVVKTDLPEDKGGEGTAPNPFQILLVSIAACSSLYALGFFQKRGLSTEGLEMEQHHEFDEAGARLTKVLTTVKLPAQFPEKYRDALLRSVEKCKVRQTILDPPEFEVTTSSAD